MTQLLRLATRMSPLALWQAGEVARVLRRHHPRLATVLVPMSSSGDGDHATPLYRLGTIGVFCKEVQQAVLEGRADAGVHSCKDLPTSEPEGLTIAAVLARGDARDALIGAPAVAALPPGALIGTSSLRRQAQLAQLRGDLRFTSIRGNVATRLRKVADGEVAATVMAMAGIGRLGLLRQARAVALDPWRACTPAPAQGAVAVDCRTRDGRTRFLLSCLDHRESAMAVGIERRVLAGLAGGCSLPLGCLARRQGAGWTAIARLGRDGGMIEAVAHGSALAVADQLLAALTR
jgi:hydroxymethylbilane synthase